MIEKVGKLPIPISLNIKFDDDSDLTVYKSADVWKDAKKEIWLDAEILKKVKSVELGNSNIPDMNEKNDYCKKF